MAKKYTYEEVRDYYESLGCSLLSPNFLNCSTLMKFRCACGGDYEKSFTQFKQSPRCHDCAMKKKANSRSHKPVHKVINGVETACKECTKCAEIKPLDEFQKAKRGSLGRQSKCTECRHRQAEKYRREKGQKERERIQIEYLNIEGKEVPSKKCRACEEVKPLDDFQSAGPNSKSIGGKIPKCRKCNNKTDQRKSKSDVKVVIKDGTKLDLKFCTGCEDWFPLENFKKYRDNRLDKEVYYSKCKDCESKYVEDNHDRIKRRGRDHYHRVKHTEEYKQYVKRYNEENKDLLNFDVQRRLAYRRSLPNDIKNGDFRRLREYFNNVCALSESSSVNIEHFIPLSWGHGGTIKGNLYLLDRNLNINKSNKNPFEWVKDEEIKHKIDLLKWKRLVRLLADQTGMSVEEFKNYVYWCEENQRDVEQIKRDNCLSVNLYKNYINSLRHKGL